MNSEPLTILGIESSCDETALAVIKGHPNSTVEVLSECIFSQITEHEQYGGVVPEIAARSHAYRIPDLLSNVMHDAQINFNQLDAIAVTSEPGLIGGVLVGLMVAKGLCVSWNKPLVAVNHLEGHALSPQITQKIEFPYLLLLASGGHCQILIVYDVGRYQLLGSTIDDSAGEAFDKIAKMLDIGFPGGPAVEKLARSGDSCAYNLPRPLKGTQEPNFSFSGLKTAVLRTLQTVETIDKPNLCASFQQAVSECFQDRLKVAMTHYKNIIPSHHKYRLVVAGGVAANLSIRHALEQLCKQFDFDFFVPPLKYCTDNGVMIAYAGLCHAVRGNFSSLDYSAKARSPLESSVL